MLLLLAGLGSAQSDERSALDTVVGRAREALAVSSGDGLAQTLQAFESIRFLPQEDAPRQAEQLRRLFLDARGRGVSVEAELVRALARACLTSLAQDIPVGVEKDDLRPAVRAVVEAACPPDVAGEGGSSLEAFAERLAEAAAKALLHESGRRERLLGEFQALASEAPPVIDMEFLESLFRLVSR